jgi:hypothetical protein
MDGSLLVTTTGTILQHSGAGKAGQAEGHETGPHVGLRGGSADSRMNSRHN